MPKFTYATEIMKKRFVWSTSTRRKITICYEEYMIRLQKVKWNEILQRTQLLNNLNKLV